MMSPEQARGGEADERSDLFSFGIVLYEMLTGHSPFRGSSPLETLNRVTSSSPTRVDALRPGVPPRAGNADRAPARQGPGRSPRRARPTWSGLSKPSEPRQPRLPRTASAISQRSPESGWTRSAAPVPALPRLHPRRRACPFCRRRRYFREIAIAAVLALLVAASYYLLHRQPEEPKKTAKPAQREDPPGRGAEASGRGRRRASCPRGLRSSDREPERPQLARRRGRRRSPPTRGRTEITC